MLPLAPSSLSVYTIIFIVSFCCWLGFEIWVFSRERGQQRRDARSGAAWVILALAIGITLGVNMPGMAPGFNIQGTIALYLVPGTVLIWAGILLRFWSIQTLGKFFSTRLVIQEGHELITKGPYKYLRNPSYTAALITFIGLGLGVGNWLSIAVLFLTGLITYVWRIRVEGRMLLDQFGVAYSDYMKRTWALIPFIW